MKFEHLALNVHTPKKVAAWYQDQMGLEIVSSMTKESFTYFFMIAVGGGVL